MTGCMCAPAPYACCGRVPCPCQEPGKGEVQSGASGPAGEIGPRRLQNETTSVLATLPRRQEHATCADRSQRVCGQEALVREIDRRLPCLWRADADGRKYAGGLEPHPDLQFETVATVYFRPAVQASRVPVLHTLASASTDPSVRVPCGFVVVSSLHPARAGLGTRLFELDWLRALAGRPDKRGHGLEC